MVNVPRGERWQEDSPESRAMLAIGRAMAERAAKMDSSGATVECDFRLDTVLLPKLAKELEKPDPSQNPQFRADVMEAIQRLARMQSPSTTEAIILQNLRAIAKKFEAERA